MRITKDPDIRRQEIIDSARELFQSKGIKGTSMNDIAENIGVAKGLIYYYFSSKEELLKTVLDEFIKDVDEALKDIAEKSLDFYRKLSTILNIYFKSIQANQDILSYLPGDPEMFSHVRNRLSDLAMLYAKDLIDLGIKLGILHIKYPDYLLKIIIRGLADIYIEGITEPYIHATLIEQILGLKDGSITLT